MAERAFQKCVGRLCSDQSEYPKSAVLSRYFLAAAPNSSRGLGSELLPSQWYCPQHRHFLIRFKLAERAFQKCIGRLCSDQSGCPKSEVLSRFCWRFTCTAIEKRQGRFRKQWISCPGCISSIICVSMVDPYIAGKL